jgi:anti-sigma regulatory factor (Ser/Thr protein kinase)
MHPETRYRPGSHAGTFGASGRRRDLWFATDDGGAALMHLVVDLEPSAQAPARARSALAGTGAVLDADVQADLLLVVSELVTNSVKYGPGRPIRVDVQVHGARRVRGEVVDQGEGAEVVAAAAPDDDEPGGRGLRIVDQLARWGVHEGSTHVWFDLGDG